MTHLKPGDPAPDFSAPDQNGNTLTLGDFKGQKLVLFFYPHDMTPTCTVEACNLRDHYAELQRPVRCTWVSEDSEAKHQKFIAKHELLPPHCRYRAPTSQAYGVWGEKKFMGKIYDGTHRTTFVIDEKGAIQQVITKSKAKSTRNKFEGATA